MFGDDLLNLSFQCSCQRPLIIPEQSILFGFAEVPFAECYIHLLMELFSSPFVIKILPYI